MTTKRKLIRTNPKTGKPDWGEGPVQGWAWERTCHPRDAERTLTNLLLGAFEAYRNADFERASRILFTRVGDSFAWQLLCEGIQDLARSLQPQEAQPAPPAEKVEYPLTPEMVRDEIESKVKQLRLRPKKWEMRPSGDRPGRMAWTWEAGDWRAVEINSERKARWLRQLPEFVPGYSEGRHPDHSGQVAEKDAKEREDIQAMQEVGEDLEQRISKAEAFPDTWKHKEHKIPRESLPGNEWLHRFDDTDPVYGIARKSKTLRSCELCLAAIQPGEEWVASSKSSSKRAHKACFAKRRMDLIDRRNA